MERSARSIRHVMSTSISSEQDDAMSQLQRQLSEKQQLKIDNDRKDMLITDLRHQVAELTKYKEQAFNLRQQLAVTEERSKIRESDYAQRQREQADMGRRFEERETSIRVQLQASQDAQSEQQRLYSQRVSNLEAQLDSSRTDVERRDVRISKLDYELANTHKELQLIQKHNAEREATFLNQIRHLQDQVANATAERNELQSAAESRASNTDALRREIQGLDDALSQTRRERDSVNRAKIEQAEALARVQGELVEREDALRRAQADAAQVPELRRDLAVVAPLQQELRSLQSRHSDLMSQLESEKLAHRLALEEKLQLQQSKEYLTKSMAEMRALLAPESELSEKRRQVEQLGKEVERCRGSISTLQEEVAQSRQAIRDYEGKFDTCTNELTVALTTLQRMIESVVAGADVGIVDTHLVLPQMEGLRLVVSGLRAKLTEAMRELVTYRDRQRIVEGELSQARAMVDAKENDRSDLQRELFELRQLLQEHESQFRVLQQERNALDVNLRDARQQLHEAEESANLRTNFISAVCKQLDVGQATSPSSPMRSPMHTMERPTWTSVQSALSELTSHAVAERDTLRRLKVELSEKLHEAESRLAATQAQLSDTWHANTKMQSDMEADMIVRMEEMKRNNEQLREELLAESSQHLHAVDAELKAARQEAMHYELENKRVQQTNEILTQENAVNGQRATRLFSAIQVMARAFRPLRIRIKELRDQKAFLTKRARRLERVSKATQDMLNQMTAEFTPQAAIANKSASRRKVSFRVAAIYIMAAWRLQRFVQTRGFMGIPTRFGRDVLYLSSAASISTDPDVPIVVGEGADTADSLHAVVRHMDPGCEFATETMFSRALFDGLGRGLREIRWHQRAMQTGAFRRAGAEPAVTQDADEQAGDVIGQIKKSQLSMTKRVREVEGERNQLTAELVETKAEAAKLSSQLLDCETQLSRGKESIYNMQRLVEQKDSEIASLVRPERYEEVRRECDSARDRLVELTHELDKARHELNAQLAQVGDARSAQARAQDQLQSLQATYEDVKRQLREKDNDLEDMRAYLKRKAHEIGSADEERRVVANRLRDTQAVVDTLSNERQQLKQRIQQLEDEVTAKTDLVSKMEHNVLAFERQRGTDEETRRQQALELQRKERELSAQQDLIKALTEAQQRAVDRAAEMEQQLNANRQHIHSLKSELLANSEREDYERRDREEWARQRLDLLNSRQITSPELQSSPSGKQDQDQLRRFISGIDQSFSSQQQQPLSSRGYTSNR